MEITAGSRKKHIVRVGVLIMSILHAVIIGSSTQSSITFRLLSLDGEKIEYVVAGEPFRLEVYMEGVGQAPQTIDVPGLDRLNAVRNGFFVATINGHSTVRYSYKAQVNKAGVFLLGPVTIQYDGKEISSDRFRIIAREERTTSAQSHTKRKALPDFFARLEIDKKEVVVGEKVSVKLRFYFKDTEAMVRQVNRIDIPQVTASAPDKPITAHEIIDGQEYGYAEWRWNIFPTEPGKLVIPAHSIDFDVVVHSTNQWSLLSLFGTRMQTKREHTNACVLNVKALPRHDGHVFLVGRIVDVHAEVNPQTAPVGQAVLLAIEIEAEGNLEGIERLELVGMPEALKYYDSKSMMIKSRSSRFNRKRFEFVIQGLQPGEWHIPAQTYTYYDVEYKAYEQQSTQPLMVHITPSPASSSNAAVISKDDKSVQDEHIHPALGRINTTGPWSATMHRTGLSWWLFWCLVILPVCVSSVLFCMPYLRGWWNEKTKYFTAFKRARNNLTRAQTSGDSHHIYYIMKSLMADRVGMPLDQLSPDTMTQALQKAGMPYDQLMVWQDFCVQLSQQVFAYQTPRPELFAQAYQWISEWEKFI
jgi:hypothetical protein